MRELKAKGANRERELLEEIDDLHEAFEKDRGKLLRMASCECEVN